MSLSARASASAAACAVLAALWAAGAAPAAGPAEPPAIFTGSERATWIVQPDRAGRTFDVAVRPTGGDWRWVGTDLSGHPAAAVACGPRLHVFFDRPAGCLMFDLSSRQPMPALVPSHEFWPRGAVPWAMCESADLGAGKGPTILAAVARPAGPRPPPSAPSRAALDAPAYLRWAGRSRPEAVTVSSAPARRRPAASPPAPVATAASAPGVPVFRAASMPSVGGRVDLGIFQWVGPTWEHLGDWQGICLASAHPRVHLAAWQDAISVLLVDKTSRMAQLREGRWQEAALPAELARGEPLGLIARGGSRGLIIPLVVPAERTGQGGGALELHLAIQDVPDGPFWFQRILRGEQPATWPAKQPPQVAAQGDQLALLWEGDGDGEGQRHFARCDPLTGQLIPAGTVSGPGKGTGDGGGLEWLGYLSWGLLLAVLLSTMFIRGRSARQPFALPAGVRAASLPRRLLALIVDLAMFYLLLSPAALWFLPKTSPEELTEELRRTLRQGIQAGDAAVQPVLILVSLGMLVLFGAYGAAMEARFGATLGKLILRVRVVGEQAGRATVRQCLARNLMKLVEMVLLATPFFVVVLLVPLLNRNRQRLGDVLSRTTVVDAGAPAQPGRANDDGRPPSESPDDDDHVA